jgi:hypothetical protein
MPLQIIDPPMAAYEAARSTIANLASQAAFRTPALRRADPAAIALSTPHRMAILRLDRIRGANDVRSVVDIKGWRFLVHEGTRVVAAVDAVQTDKGEYLFGQVNEGPFTVGTEDAIRRAEKLDQVHRGRFVPVFLLVPALYAAALWLEDQDGDADLVMTMPPAPKNLSAFGPMEVHPFLAVLEGLAALVPAEDKKSKDPSGG